MAKLPARCAFCDSADKLTREHIFPDWLRDYIPKIFLKTRHAASTTAFVIDTADSARSELLEHKIAVGSLQRAGDPHSRKLKVVCARCNNQWMSNLQKKAKQHLVPLIHDDWVRIGTASREVLAAWATMFTMVYEFADLNTLVTPFDERNFLRLYRTPPNNWYVWLGRYRGNLWNKACNHLAIRGYHQVEADGTILALGAPPPEAEPFIVRQSTAFLLGSLFVQTFSDQGPCGIDADAFAVEHGLTAVWPPLSELKRPERVLSDYDADAISRCFMPTEFQPHIRHAWETSPTQDDPPRSDPSPPV